MEIFHLYIHPDPAHLKKTQYGSMGKRITIRLRIWVKKNILIGTRNNVWKAQFNLATISDWDINTFSLTLVKISKLSKLKKKTYRFVCIYERKKSVHGGPSYMTLVARRRREKFSPPPPVIHLTFWMATARDLVPTMSAKVFFERTKPFLSTKWVRTKRVLPYKIANKTCAYFWLTQYTQRKAWYFNTSIFTSLTSCCHVKLLLLGTF